MKRLFQISGTLTLKPCETFYRTYRIAVSDGTGATATLTLLKAKLRVEHGPDFRSFDLTALAPDGVVDFVA